MRYCMRILFWLVKNKANTQELCPIYARVTVSGKRREIATGLFCHPSKWDQAKTRIKGRNVEVNQQNARLDEIRGALKKIEFDLEYRNLPVSAETVKRIYENPESASTELLKVAEKYLRYKTKTGYSESTIKAQEVRLVNVQRALESLSMTSILLSEVTVGVMKKIKKWSQIEKKHSTSHTGRIMGFVKEVLDYAVDEELIPANPLTSFKIKRKGKPKQILYLTKEEVDRIWHYNWKQGKLERVADRFLLQCFTGMAYAELMALSKEDFFVGDDGRDWVRRPRQKTGTVFTFPVFRRAKIILEKYDYQIPKITNQRMNDYLKLVAEHVKIDKNLTTHVGRKTCATLLLLEGVPVETVAKILGHKDIRTTLALYAEVMQEKLSKDTIGIDL